MKRSLSWKPTRGRSKLRPRAVMRPARRFAAPKPNQIPRLCARIVSLCDDLFHSIVLQTSVDKYYAIGAERGAVLDFIDLPLNNRWWLEDEFKKVAQLGSESARVERLRVLATWEHPGPGSYYDAVGDLDKSPRVLHYSYDPSSRQWLNPDAFASVVDPSTGACAGGDSPVNCQFGNSGSNNVRGPHFTYSEVYVTKRVPITEHVTFRLDTQFFNVFNHANFALPSNQAGTPGEPATQTGFGAITSSISPPTGLLGVGLGGDSSPRMIAFQGRIEF